MELTRYVKETEDIEIMLEPADIRELFARAGYPIEPGTPIQVLTRTHQGEHTVPGNLGQEGCCLILRKRMISHPICQRNEEVAK